MHGLTNKDKAKLAIDKPAALGPDIEVEAYERRTKEHGRIERLSDMPSGGLERALAVGMSGEDACRAGSFLQSDHSVMLATALVPGVEVMDISEALNEHGWLERYWWSAISPDMDKYTAEAELRPDHGYFIRALEGARVELPIQACLFMEQDGISQNVHNVIIAEEGSELHIITGCATAHGVRSGLHVGVSEFYVKRGAKLTFTMIHDWAPEMAIRPRSAAIVHEDALFVSTYVCARPVATLQLYPTAYCTGRGAVARFNSVLVADKGTHMDVGSRVVLSAPGARAEINSRAVSRGGDIYVRGHMVGQTSGVRGHLECRGLILSDEGSINAVPQLDGMAKDIELSHEAAVGKISQDELNYLMARGLTPEEATSAIVTGFLDLDIPELPENIARALDINP